MTAMLIAAQGGRRRTAPNIGAMPTVKMDPTLVCTGEIDDMKVRIRRIAPFNRGL